MTNKTFSLDYNKCDPKRCNDGSCPAADNCPLKLISQEEPFSYPMNSAPICKGCAKCASACPLDAIILS